MTPRKGASNRYWLPLARGAALRLLLLALCVAVFAVVLTLFHVPAEPAYYAGALCAVPVATFSLLQALRLRARHRELEHLRNGLPDTLSHLPEPHAPLEEDYQLLLKDMGRLHTRRIGEDDLRYQQMTEYYTLWSHQIKTPLAAMGLLLSRQDDERSRVLQAELKKTEHYVDMALNYMRLDSPESDYRFEPVQLQGAAQSAARRYAGQFVLKRLTLTNEVPEHVVAVSDRKWLVFVLEQLLSNAVKYTHTGGVRITWNDAERTLCILDTGTGIPTEDLPRVFDQGFTGYAGRVEPQATGIGLYLCREACKRLGHTLTLTSRPGEGTQACVGFQQNTAHGA